MAFETSSSSDQTSRASINTMLNKLTIGYTFLDPKMCKAHSSIRAMRQVGVDAFKEGFSQHGWDTNQKIVAMEVEDAEVVTPLSTIFGSSEEEVSMISWHVQSYHYFFHISKCRFSIKITLFL